MMNIASNNQVNKKKIKVDGKVGEEKIIFEDDESPVTISFNEDGIIFEQKGEDYRKVEYANDGSMNVYLDENDPTNFVHWDLSRENPVLLRSLI